ncbi:hypothetical protein [Streptomyces sp. NPDC085479]|uniref:hypothetical protein n=1 Tax=Streptomyces sp. NPDC085479 TaxID=3365726 RepID=UPI0037CD8225
MSGEHPTRPPGGSGPRTDLAPRARRRPRARHDLAEAARTACYDTGFSLTASAAATTARVHLEAGRPEQAARRSSGACWTVRSTVRSTPPAPRRLADGVCSPCTERWRPRGQDVVEVYRHLGARWDDTRCRRLPRGHAIVTAHASRGDICLR